MTILIVDDTASQRFVLTKLLQSAGYTEVVAVESAAAALARLAQAHHPSVDLILMDISMPEMNGIEACRLLKQQPTTQDIPIIMVTASTETEDLQAAFDAGAMDYITKPPSRVDLLARARSALRLKHEIDRRKGREEELAAVNDQLQEVVNFLREEQAKSERLLLNILPRPVAERLKDGENIIADNFAEVTVLFADIVDFTQQSAQLPAARLVQLLNDIFSRFDALAEKHRLEKIKTIGDAYMVVGGLPTPRPDHTAAVAAMALDMLTALAEHRAATGSTWAVRIGLHSGPVIAGVIGTKKFIYDLWGDTVNIASRMEELGTKDRIQISAAAQTQLNGRYRCEGPLPLQVKGKGTMEVYYLLGPT